MNSSNSTIWMNVTTSINWNRPPVGIVRVERSLCESLAKSYGPRFKQCAWNGHRFVEVLPRAQEIMQSAKFGIEKECPLLPPMFPILTKRQALAALAQGMLSLMPNKFAPAVNRFLYFIKPRVVRFLSNESLKGFRRLNQRFLQIASRGNGRVLPPKYENFASIFSRGDTLISVGLDWDYTYYKRFYDLRKNNGVKVVTCCYDLIPVLYPQYCVSNVANLFASYFLELADASDAILCISKQSERDLKEMLYRMGGPNTPTHVLRLGDNVPIIESGEISRTVAEMCLEPFILFVSTIERRKNHEVLYRAYHLLSSQGKRSYLPKLVFVGMQGWGVSELIKDIELDPQIQGLIVFFNHVNDAELSTLYKAAQFCVFPSLYEGWGLPVGEALAMGKAVICSNRGSLPEVGGDIVQYLDPWNPNEWADAIQRMATDESWRRQWEERVKEGYCRKEWAETALAVRECVDNL